MSNDGTQAWLLTQGPVFSQWDISEQRVIKSIGADELLPNTRRFAISENETRLLSSDGKTVLLWQLDGPELLGSLDFSAHLGDANISAMAFIGDLEFVVGNTDGSFIFADIQNQLFRRSHLHSNEVTKLLVDNNKTTLYSAGNDGKVLATDLQLLELQFEHTAPYRITSLVSNKDHSRLFISDALDRQVIWRPRQNEVLTTLDFFEQYRFFRLGMFLEKDSKLLTTSPKTEVSLWDTQTGGELARWQATSLSFGSTIVDLVIDDDKTLTTITSDSVIETWDMSKF